MVHEARWWKGAEGASCANDLKEHKKLMLKAAA
jgi:hypothetical protein